MAQDNEKALILSKLAQVSGQGFTKLGFETAGKYLGFAGVVFGAFFEITNALSYANELKDNTFKYNVINHVIPFLLIDKIMTNE